MGSHMKTTVEISDALLSEARRVAARRGVTLRTILEEGLRQVLKAERGKPRFTLRDASFGGTGLDPEFADGNWERIRDTAYSGRGA